MLCTDGFTISFQPSVDGNDYLLHHHSHTADGPSVGTQRSRIGRRMLHPIEFRRRVMMKPAPRLQIPPELAGNASPMTKLLMEQERQRQPAMIPWVEIYPLKLSYTVVETEKIRLDSPTGFALVSRRSSVFDSLQGLMKAAAPQTISSCRRIWRKRINIGTKNAGDGFEMVDLDGLDGNLLSREGDSVLRPQLSIDQWIQSHGKKLMKELEILVEVRRADDSWPRKNLEFGNRLQIGDFVDAQDSAGKWYEAIVRNMDDDSVLVHYFGWASKWDCRIPRMPGKKLEGTAAVSWLSTFLHFVEYIHAMSSHLRIYTTENTSSSSSLDTL